MALQTVGVSIAQALGVEAGKVAIQQLLSNLSSKELESVISFGLFCDFKEMPSYDTASSQLNEIILSKHPKGQQLIQDNQTFAYDVFWDYMDGYEIPESSWEYDVLAKRIEDQESIDRSIVSSGVSGFILWLKPLSLSKKKEMMLSAYQILDDISKRTLANPYFSISRINKFAFVVLNQEDCSRIQSRLAKKMEKSRLQETIESAPIRSGKILLTVPLREMLTVLALADSFKRGLF